MEFLDNYQLIGLLCFLGGAKMWAYCSAMEREEHLKKTRLERILIFKPDLDVLEASARMIRRSFVLSLLGAVMTITGVFLFISNMG